MKRRMAKDLPPAMQTEEGIYGLQKQYRCWLLLYGCAVKKEGEDEDGRKRGFTWPIVHNTDAKEIQSPIWAESFFQSQ